MIDLSIGREWLMQVDRRRALVHLARWSHNSWKNRWSLPELPWDVEPVLPRLDVEVGRLDDH